MNGGATFRASGTSARLNDPGAGTSGDVERGMSPVADRRRAHPQRRPPTRAALLFRPAASRPSSTSPAPRRFEVRRGTGVARGRPVVVVPDGGRRLPPPLSTSALRTRRTERVLVEGGATLNGELIRLGLVDEYFLTLAPKITGGATAHPAVQWPGDPTASADQTASTSSTRCRPQTGELFLRYRVQQRPRLARLALAHQLAEGVQLDAEGLASDRVADLSDVDVAR